jgi:hypothetical protein
MVVSPELMQTAQVVTGATFAGWLLTWYLPEAVQRPVRLALLVLYLIGAAALVLYASLNG